MRLRMDRFQLARRVADADHEWPVRARRERAVEIATAIAQPISVTVKAEQRCDHQVGCHNVPARRNLYVPNT